MPHFRDFWIRIDGNVTVGYGTEVGSDEFMRWHSIPEEQQYLIHGISFVTTYNQQGHFSLLKRYGKLLRVRAATSYTANYYYCASTLQ